MSHDSEVESPEHLDAVALARLFVSGRSIKRGETIQMVRDLLAIIDASKHLDMPPAIWKEETVSDDHLHMVSGPPPASGSLPPATGYDAKPPIAVHQSTAGSVFLGPEANRYFTPSEAIALAGAIARAATRSV